MVQKMRPEGLKSVSSVSPLLRNPYLSYKKEFEFYFGGLSILRHIF